MDRTWLQLPGPAGFVNTLNETLAQGSNVLLSLPEEFSEAMYLGLHSLNDRQPRLLHKLKPDETEALCPFDYICQELTPKFGRRVETIDGLIANDTFNGKCVWVELPKTSETTPWLHFITDYAKACRASSRYDWTVFCILSPEIIVLPTSTDKTLLTAFRWDGALMMTDVWAYSRQHLPKGDLNPFIHNMLAAIVAELAGFDPNLAEYLCACHVQNLFSPVSDLCCYAKKRNWTPEEAMEPSWRKWQVGIDENGHQMIHSALLALAGNAQEISKRVWRAQTRVLFALIEELRIWILPSIEKFLHLPLTSRAPNGDTLRVDRLDGLEIGELFFHLTRISSCPQHLIDRVYLLKEIRHRLAHTELVGAEILFDSGLSNLLSEFSCPSPKLKRA